MRIALAVVVMGIVSGILFVLAPQTLSVIAPGFDAADYLRGIPTDRVAQIHLGSQLAASFMIESVRSRTSNCVVAEPAGSSWYMKV